MSVLRLCSVVLFVGVMVGCASSSKSTAKAGGTMGVSEGPALPSPRGSHAGGMVNGQAVVAGGTAWSADRKTKSWLADSVVFRDEKWIPGPPLPHPVSEPMFASDGKGLYVVGGRRGGGATEVNDDGFRLIEADGKLRWDEMPRLPQGRTAGGGAILDGRLFIACGSTSDGATNRVLSLDFRSSGAAWRERSPLPGPARLYPALVACGRYVYLFGGMRIVPQAGMEVFNDAYRYDPKSDAWERLPDLPARGYCWAASPIDDAHVLLTGRADGRIHDEVWRVSLKDMRVQSAGRLVIRSTCAPLMRVGDAWWLVGGEPDSNKTRTERVSVIR
jgi:N-acetylneuraminic acid mutarotase